LSIYIVNREYKKCNTTITKDLYRISENTKELEKAEEILK